MSAEPHVRPQIGSTVPSDVVERLHEHYMAGLSDQDRADWFDEYQSLTEEEQEVLKWKIEEGDSAVRLFIDELKKQGAVSIADLDDTP